MALTPKRVYELAASARGATHRTEADIDRWLNDLGIKDPCDRIAVKVQLELDAAGELQTDQTIDFRLATDTARYTPPAAPVSREVATWARRAGVDLRRSWTERELNELLDRSGLGVVERVALKTELASYGLLYAAAAAPHGMQAGRGRDMRASAADRPRGHLLRDAATGAPLVLRSRP